MRLREFSGAGRWYWHRHVPPSLRTERAWRCLTEACAWVFVVGVIAFAAAGPFVCGAR
jgi:hypothetical protein